MKAISAGLFPYFLKQNDVDAEKEFAIVRISKVAGTSPAGATQRLRCTLKEVGKPGPEYSAGGLPAALNCFHLKGYIHHESQLKTKKDTYTFSRRKHDVTVGNGVTDIFIPNDNESLVQKRNNQVKQFAVDMINENETLHFIFAPAEFQKDESARANPLRNASIRDPGPWLEDNGFVTRENAYEDIFREQFETIIGDGVKISIFSRMTSKSRDDASW